MVSNLYSDQCFQTLHILHYMVRNYVADRDGERIRCSTVKFFSLRNYFMDSTVLYDGC